MRYIYSTYESYQFSEIERKVNIAFNAYLDEDANIACELEKEEEENGEHSGHPFFICTNGAEWVRDNFFPEAVIMGYHHDNNPTAEIGEVEGGHDFLILDGRYIIDFWYRSTYENDSPILLDMEKDQSLVSRYYGDPATWVPVERTVKK